MDGFGEVDLDLDVVPEPVGAFFRRRPEVDFVDAGRPGVYLVLGIGAERLESPR